jgi:hypothetical protein
VNSLLDAARHLCTDVARGALANQIVQTLAADPKPLSKRLDTDALHDHAQIRASDLVDILITFRHKASFPIV